LAIQKEMTLVTLPNHLNNPQKMWIDVIHSTISEPRFDLEIGDMNYVIRNMIAKYVSSADQYLVSEGVELLIESNEMIYSQLTSGLKLDLRKLFYGSKSVATQHGKPTMFEHCIPASVVRDELLKNRNGFISGKLSASEFRLSTEKTLLNSGTVIIVLKEENERLSRFKMPLNWEYRSGDRLARYKQANPEVRISSKYKPFRDHHICR
jgi:hypothetical protein